MEVVTFVMGKVPTSKLEEFKSGYETLTKETKPDGLISSHLCKIPTMKNFLLLNLCGKVLKL